MYYKIGDVSKILGISPDLMRYYEKKGIVKPHKDETNDYRYYEVWDVNFLIECLWFKQFDFGMKEISRIVAQSSYENLQLTLAEKEESLEKEIIHKQLLLRRLRQHREILERGMAALNICNVEQSPEIIRYLNRYNFLYDDSPKVQELGRQWLAYFPFINRCFDVDREVLMRDGDDFAWGFSMPLEYARLLEVDIKPPVERFEPCTCIHSVIRQEGKYGFSPKLLHYMVDYAREKGFQICGNARGQLLCSVRENDVMTGYFEAWIPVEKSS